MKKMLTALCLLLGTVAWATEGDFTKTMTAAELAKSGLEKLSPEELAQLKTVVERYKAGAVEIVQQQAESKVAAAETKVAAAEAKAKQAEQTAPGDKKKPGWLRALITLEKSTGNVEQDGAVESKIAGNFTGWSGKTLFHLENGQIWQQVNAGEYETPPVPSPHVKIFPAKLGGFWMEVDGVNPRVKVKPVKLD
jgi:hypothetical protein